MNNRLCFKPTLKVASILLLLLFVIVSCSDNIVGPNDIGGDVILELTEPGNDFPVAFWNIKVIQVEETIVDDPLISSVKYIGNHIFGLVGFNVVSKNNKTMKLTVFPPTLK